MINATIDGPMLSDEVISHTQQGCSYVEARGGNCLLVI